MVCLPEPSEETTAAVKISAKCAADLVVEARAERDAQHARAICDLIADLEENGLPEYISLSASDFSEKLDRRQAQDALSMYVKPRYSKILRARMRRYERLKYQHELIHPPFSHPEFPEHPALTMWKAEVEVIDHKGGWGSQGWGWGSWSAEYAPPVPPVQFLREEDDEISPVVVPRPLPFV
ncbi:hypothetical protein B0H14DRAFT_3503879 [Mycena olivaceomarginata]|nr:hypothetical protein B0H14DRAFT_3503879 [Mycena olivaceomarginata]